MSIIQIKGVPEEVHAELRRRAEQSGKTLRDFVLGLIERELAAPSKVDWFESLSKWKKVPLDVSSAELVREARAERYESRRADRR